MEDRTRNIFIGIIVLFGVMGVGSALILPYVKSGAARGGPGAAEQARTGAPAPPGRAGPPAPVGQTQSRQDRLGEANSHLEQGRTEDARTIYQGLVDEGVNDAVRTAAQLALTTLQAAGAAVRNDPEVARAHVALHRARASLLAFRGANGRYPSKLEDPGLEQFGFSNRDLLSDVQRLESYRTEGGDQFEITAVARDPRGTRVRATDRAVEDLP